MGYYSEDRLDIIPNELGIYQIANSVRKWWYVYIKLPNEPRIRKSLKTTNKREAERKAKDLYFKYRSFSEEGLPIGDVSWKQLRKRYRDSVSYKPTTGHRLKMLDIYFTRFKDIKKINTEDVGQWERWRRQFWSSKQGAEYRKKHNVAGRPLHSDISERTLRMEAVVLKSILSFARERGMLQHVPEIGMLTRGRQYLSRGKRHRRAAFTGKEHRIITNYLSNQYKEITKASKAKTTGYYHAKAKGNTYYQTPIRKNRRMWAWVHLLHKSGLRPQEAVGLRWCDIGIRHNYDEGVDLLEIEITEENSKTGQARMVYVVEYSTVEKGTSYLKKVLDEWRDVSLWSDDNDWVFGNVNKMGKRERKAAMFLYFTRMIKEQFAKHKIKNPDSKIEPLIADKHGREYSSYSYRHFYATRKLEQGINAYYLCEMMGTSMTQLRNHYGHLMTWDTTIQFIERQGAYNERQASNRRGVVLELMKTS